MEPVVHTDGPTVIFADHRVRTAEARREQMRAHLIHSALGLLAQQGVTSNLIDELIRTAGVSRGTFYNYFSSVEALLEAVSTKVSSELIQEVNPIVLSQPGPAARVSCGVRLCLHAGQIDRDLAAFVSRGGLAALQQNRALTDALCRDLADGIASGPFLVRDIALAYDLVVGPVLAGYYRLATGNVEPDYIDDVACAVLVALGVRRITAKHLSRRVLPEFAYLQSDTKLSVPNKTQQRKKT